MLIYSYTTLVTYICARYVSALLIAVDIPLCSTRLCRPERLRFKFLIPVGIQLYRAGDIYLRQICFLLLFAFDIPLWSARLCRPKRHRFKLSIAADIQLRQICFRFADCG